MRIGDDVPRRGGSDPLDGAEDAVRKMHDAALRIDDSGLGMGLSLHRAEIPRLRADPLFLSTVAPLGGMDRSRLRADGALFGMAE